MDVGAFFDNEEITADLPFGGGPDPAIIKLRYVSSETMAALVKKATKTTYNAKHQREEKTDNTEFKRLLGEAAVIGWSGITAGGQDVEFSPAKRDQAMAGWTDFAKFVVDMCDDLQALVQADREAVRGN